MTSGGIAPRALSRDPILDRRSLAEAKARVASRFTTGPSGVVMTTREVDQVRRDRDENRDKED